MKSRAFIFNDFDLDFLGIKDFELEPAEKIGAKELSEENFKMFKHICPKCGFEFDDDPK